MKFFGTVRQKTFDTKSWHKSLKPKIFRYPKLMTHWWVPLRSFSALWDKKFDRKSWYFPPPPLFFIFFRDQKFSEAQIRKVSLRNLSALWDKIFDTKSWHNSLEPKIFQYPKIMTHWWIPYEVFRHCETKKLWQEIVLLPPPPLIHKLFRYQKVCEAKNGSTTKVFGTVRQKFFIRK